MTMDDYLRQLGHAHGFTLDELRANQRGELHPAQVARGHRQGTFALVVLVAIGVLALAGGLAGAWVFGESLGPPPSTVDRNAVIAILGAGGVVALGFFFAAWRTRARQRARRAAFAQARIDVLEGPVHKSRVTGNVRRHLFRVGGRSFDTTEKLWELLTQGATYRLHCVHDQLLTLAPVVEPVTDDPVERGEYDHEMAQFERSLGIKPSGLVK